MAKKKVQAAQSSGRQVTLTLPMEQDFELVATETASALANLCGCNCDQIDEVRMAVIEACINAFEHSGAADRKVDVKFEPMDDRLVIVVEDRGKGIKREAADAGPRETADGRRRGFGFRIIKAMMDDVKVLPPDGTHGTRIVMVKLRSGREPVER